MATTFHAFPELPAELRAAIWEYALHNEKSKVHTTKGRAIQLLNYDPSAGTISVVTSTRYPLLFAVNREARYEAAKLDNCEWITIHARHHGYDQASTYETFQVCINFSRDLIYIPEMFLKLRQRHAWVLETKTPEHYHLEALSRLLDAKTIEKIQYLSVSTRPPPKGPRFLNDDAWWRGEGLSIFCLGRLKSVHLFSTKQGHAAWAKLSVEDYLQYHWVENGWRTQRPVVTVTDRRCANCGIEH
ncbi:hypothetical protein BDW02DRAFT_396121 [Decorospora gaudefroyi]|uniref:2EXR domain-containing protein n=1 Tax=Decorospora gaudefroyi TaxID=184978 RepID=A0A6A5K791_9PLEO|nr:hypothetical protein BDW02DRAFT_396121 [Decorospora gaudefroyi]